MHGLNISGIKSGTLAQMCSEILEEQLDKKILNEHINNKNFWSLYFSDERYPKYFENKYFLENCFDKDKESCRTLRKIFFESLEKGSSSALIIYDKEYKKFNPSSNEETKLKDIKSAIFQYNQELSTLYADFLCPRTMCFRWHKNYKQYLDFDYESLSRNLKANFLARMLTATSMYDDLNFYNFENAAIQMIKSSNGMGITEHEIWIANQLLFRYEDDDQIEAQEILLEILEKKLSSLNAKKIIDKYESVFSRDFEQSPDKLKDYILLINNIQTADHRLNSINSDKFLKDKDYLINYSHKNLDSKIEREISYFIALYQKTALSLLHSQDCLRAKKYYNNARIFIDDALAKRPYLWLTRREAYENSLLVANCFLNKMPSSRYKNDAEFFINIAKNYALGVNKKESEKIGPITTAFIELSELHLSLNSSETEFSYESLEKLSKKLLKNQKNINLAQDRFYLREFFHSYFMLIKILQEKDPKQNFESLFSIVEFAEKIDIYKSLGPPTEKEDTLFLSEVSLDNSQKKLYELNSSDLNKFRNKLKEKEAILSYHSGLTGTIAILQTRDDRKIFNFKINEHELNHLNRMLRKSIVKGFKDNEFDFATSYDLYKKIFFEVDSYLNGAATIYLYGSELQNLPFNALVSKKSKDINRNLEKLLEASWLIDKHNFIRIFPINQDRNITFEDKFLGFANSAEQNKYNLVSIGNVLEEVEQLAIASQSKNIFANEQATKQSFLTESQKNVERIVIATHSLPPFWQGKSNEPALFFSDVETNNFFLTASEIAELNIQSDLIVLSACNSDLRNFNSLYRAFLVAGANSVLYSNWELSTRSAPELTTKFFSSLYFDPLKDKHEALREAILEIKNDFSENKFAHPAYWANFSLAYGSLN